MWWKKSSDTNIYIATRFTIWESKFFLHQVPFGRGWRSKLARATANRRCLVRLRGVEDKLVCMLESKGRASYSNYTIRMNRSKCVQVPLLQRTGFGWIDVSLTGLTAGQKRIILHTLNFLQNAKILVVRVGDVKMKRVTALFCYQYNTCVNHHI